MNSLKNISIRKFVEHVVDNNATSSIQVESKKMIPILSKEEREANLLNKFKNAINLSLEGLNIKNLIDLKENNEGSIVEDDNVSVTSSRYFSNMQRSGNRNIKLPHIIGTNDFFKSEYLGVSNEERKPNEPQDIVERRLTNLAEGVEVNLNTVPVNNNPIINSPLKQTLPSVPIPNISNTVANVPNVPNVPSVPINPKIPIPPPLNLTKKTSSLSPTKRIQGEPNIESPTRETKPADLKSSLEQRFRGQTVMNNTVPVKSESEIKEITKPKAGIKLDAFLRRNTTRQANFYKIDDEDEEEEGPLFKKVETIRPSNVKNNLFENTTETKPIEQPKEVTLPKPEQAKPKDEPNNNLESIYD
jgi:hypothetical protein